MKRGAFAAALLAGTLLCANAAAQTLPDVACFSPGLTRVHEALCESGAMCVEARFTAEDALYARDLSVLNDMLSGAALRYDGDAGADRLRITRDGATLLDATLLNAAQPDGRRLLLNGEAYALADGLLAGLPQGGEPLAWPLFERVPLDAVANWLESLAAGDALFGGLRVARAFAVERTLSGERVSRIDIDGAVAPDGGAAYEVTGYLTQPDGKAPKDAFELTASLDGDNHFTLSYSSRRSSEITRRDKAGRNSVQTTLNSTGELNGSRIDSRLTVRLTNDWTAEDEALSERIAITVHLGHTDRTPGRRMQRLNDIAADLRATLSLTTRDADAGPIAVANEATLAVEMDDNAFLGGGMSANAVIGAAETGADAADSASVAGTLSTAQDVQALLKQTARGLAARLYPSLGEGSRGKIEDGLALEAAPE